MPEPKSSPRLWHPFGFFDDLWQNGGLLFIGLTALMFLAVAAFFFLIFRHRVIPFFSLPFFLSLVPFILCSGISALQFYLVLGGLPPHAELETAGDALASIQYPFQFGLVCSGALIALYLCAYGFSRHTRHA